MNESRWFNRTRPQQRNAGRRSIMLGLLLGTMLSAPLAVPAAAEELRALTEADLGVVGASAAVSQAQTQEQAQANKEGPFAKVGDTLASLYHSHQNYLATSEAQAFQGGDTILRVIGDDVIVEAVASGDPDALRQDLEAAGMTDIAVAGQMVGGRLPMDSIADVAGLQSLQFMRPSYATTNIGKVTSEAGKALKANWLRAKYGVRGRKVRVGVMSDSFDCLGGANADFNSKDLPPKKTTKILSEGPCPATDEGRAMMQLVRDVAPAAKQSFYSAFNGIPDFANGIKKLAATGADIIVDDVIYFNEPMFQDGTVAKAVDTVKKQGVSYFSSAGNSWRDSWESGNKGFVDSGNNGNVGDQHDFDTTNGKDSLLSVRFGQGVTYVVLQWDQPYRSAGPKGSKSDLALVFYFQGSGNEGLRADSNNIGNDPTEIMRVPLNGSGTADLAIELVSGPRPRFMKIVFYGPGGSTYPVEFDTLSGTLYGHANAGGAIATGAAAYNKTPAFGTNPPQIESFSSAGGTPIFFNKKGVRLTNPKKRQKPELTSVDGTITTFFGSGNRFFGTSAAAPHAAAVGALLMEIDPGITPNQMKFNMTRTAIDMDDPLTKAFDKGFDYGTGYGLLNAIRAGNRTNRFK